MNFTRHPVCDFHVAFEPVAHEYRLVDTPDDYGWSTGEPMPSVTQFVKYYTSDFDKDTIAEHTARKRGMTKQQVLAEWEETSKYACDMGTRVHENQECFMNGQSPRNNPQNDRERGIMSSGYEAMKTILEAGWRPIAAEKMVVSLHYKLAGTIDAMFSRGREIMIADWKTNKAIERSSRYGKKCKPPISHLDDCEYTKYSLQLSLYMEILLRDRYINEISQIRLAIIHLTPSGFKVYPVTPLEERYRLLLDYLSPGGREWFEKTAVPF